MKTETELRKELAEAGWLPEVLTYDGFVTKGYVALFTKGDRFLKGQGPGTHDAIASIHAQMLVKERELKEQQQDKWGDAFDKDRD